MNAVNDNGDMVIGGLNNSGNVDKDAVLVYLSAGGTGFVLATEGDPVDADGNGLFDDNAYIDVFGNDDGVLSNNGQFYFVASLQDDLGVSIGNAFLSIAVPEPSSLALLSLAARCRWFVADAGKRRRPFERDRFELGQKQNGMRVTLASRLIFQFNFDSVGLSSALSQDHGGNRLQQNANVVPQRSSADVRDVHSHPFAERNLAAPLHLPNAGEAGRDIQAAAVPAFAGIGFAHRKRPRADQCHVASENVPKLWQLIDAGLAKDVADARDARVVRQLERRAVLLAELAKRGLLLFGIHHHRSKFVNRERLATQASALLREDDRPFRAKLDQQCGGDDERRSQNHSARRTGDIDHSLPPRQRTDEQALHALHRRAHVHAGFHTVKKIRNEISDAERSPIRADFSAAVQPVTV